MEQHSGVTKKVLSAVAVSIFYCHLGFLAVSRGSERFNLAGLEKRKEGRYFFYFFLCAFEFGATAIYYIVSLQGPTLYYVALTTIYLNKK